MDDHVLLQEFVERQSEQAFAQLVERHLPLVYGTALRLVRESHAAEDIAQTVFIQLARKAWSIQRGQALPGWLYRTTQRTAFAALRAERRRTARETNAMNLADQNQPVSEDWVQFAPLLDDALRQLSRLEQDAVLLRFFQDQSYREIGSTLGLEEEAARKRIERALDKIRLQFSRRGVTTTVALLASAITSHAAPPPPTGLAFRVSSNSLAGAAGAGGMVQVLWKTLYMTTPSKIITTVVVIAMLSAIPVGIYYWTSPPPTPPVPDAPALPQVVSSPPKPAPVAFPIAPVRPTVVVAPKIAPVPATSATPAGQPQPTALDPTIQKAITNNLRQIATAASQFMLDKMRTEASYYDLVGTDTDNYIRNILPAANEDYTGIVVEQSQTQITVSTPDGSIVTFDL